MNCLSIALLLGISHQDKAPQPPLIVAIQHHDIAKATALLKAGADPNTHEILTSKPSASEGIEGGKTSLGNSALGVAIDRQSPALVKLLLDFKADPNGRDSYQWTPLMAACQRNDVSIVKLLLKRGAKPNLRNQYGDTAIIFAANVDRAKMVEELVKAGADMNGGTGQSALIIAAQCSSKESVKLLLKLGADPNFHRPSYMTPLEYAMTQGFSDEVTAMIKKAGGKGRSRDQILKEQAVESKKWDKQFEEEKKAREAKNGAYAKILPADSELISAAILDLIQYKGSDFELSASISKDGLILYDTSVGGANEYTESQMNGELDERKAGDIDLAMRTDLMRRNSKEVSFKEFQFSDSRIVLADGKKDSQQTRLFDRKSWVALMLPGYSSDGNRGVLRFWFGPTPHGAAGTLYLNKKDGKWAVVWREFAHYF